MAPAKQYDFDVAISYASEDREKADAVANALNRRHARVFYDKYEQATLWGEDLYVRLSDVYQNRARYCVIFCSKYYAAKLWTKHELRAAQARALQENQAYILPVRLDDTEIPGLLPTIAHLSWPPEDATTIVDTVMKKLGRMPYVSPAEEVVSPSSQQKGPIPSQGKGKRGTKGDEDEILEAYLKRIEKTYQTGGATEMSYRSALEDLLRELVPGITVTHEPMRQEYGSPDYVISRATSHGPLNVGYIEAKDVNANLDDIVKDAQRTEPKTHDGRQLKRYLTALDNLVLTNYCEFRWYLNGEYRITAQFVSPVIDKGLPVRKKGSRKNVDTGFTQLMIGTHAQNTVSVARLLTGFLTHSTEPIRQPKELAERMARLAHIIRDMTIVAFNQGEIPGSLSDLYTAFKQVLLPDLAVSDFADMFAQTLAYGLFAARYNHTGSAPFRRQDAAREIPETNPFLVDLFEKITSRELDKVPFVGFVDDLAQLLAQTDMNAVLADFGKSTRQEDPLIHFYETFLAQYDPKLKELRGVYYTPEPVVSYIVRSVDSLLRSHFGCEDGLANTAKVPYQYKDEHGKIREEQRPRVLLLDPACGTGTFLYAVINHIRESYRQPGNAGMWSSYVREHLLPRLFGFELLMAPYAMAHLKLGMQLAALDLPETERNAWAYDFKSKERLGVYLTNTLEEAIKRSEVLFARSLSDEANAAATVKRDLPVMVILGNPPYSYDSANTGEWISALVRDYYRVDGQPLQERNPRALQDDYVKFIRFAQWRIEQTGYGILAFISNHRYLSNTTFPGMRRSLMQTFDEIYLLNLHGSTKPKEVPPDGMSDQNVFDIQQGVAIGIFIKHPNGSFQDREIYYADLWSSRQSKYTWLSSNDVATTQWLKLHPQSPSYSFVPQDRTRAEEYERGWKLTEMMPVNSVGLYTARDGLTIQWSEAELVSTLRDFIALPTEMAREKYHLGKDSRDWQVALAQKDVRASELQRAKVQQIAYRPFDTRFTYYTGVSRGLICMPRYEVMYNMINGYNLAICFMRNSREQIVSNFFVANHIVDKTILSSADNANVAPLYIYPEVKLQNALPTMDGFEEVNEKTRPNFAPQFIMQLAKQLHLEFIPSGKGDLQKNFGPEDVFDYMYAVFYAPTYRERYAEFLKSDFPRLPVTSKIDLFHELSRLGDRLVHLHLLEQYGNAMPKYPVSGDNIVERIDYTVPSSKSGSGRVWINQEQYFEGILPEVWNFHVGGYQVCQKWLKDRKGRTLSFDDIRHYQRTVAALAETIALMEQIDNVINEHGGWPIE